MIRKYLSVFFISFYSGCCNICFPVENTNQEIAYLTHSLEEMIGPIKDARGSKVHGEGSDMTFGSENSDISELIKECVTSKEQICFRFEEHLIMLKGREAYWVRRNLSTCGKEDSQAHIIEVNIPIEQDEYRLSFFLCPQEDLEEVRQKVKLIPQHRLKNAVFYVFDYGNIFEYNGKELNQLQDVSGFLLRKDGVKQIEITEDAEHFKQVISLAPEADEPAEHEKASRYECETTPFISHKTRSGTLFCNDEAARAYREGSKDSYGLEVLKGCDAIIHEGMIYSFKPIAVGRTIHSNLLDYSRKSFPVQIKSQSDNVLEISAGPNIEKLVNSLMALNLSQSLFSPYLYCTKVSKQGTDMTFGEQQALYDLIESAENAYILFENSLLRLDFQNGAAHFIKRRDLQVATDKEEANPNMVECNLPEGYTKLWIGNGEDAENILKRVQVIAMLSGVILANHKLEGGILQDMNGKEIYQVPSNSCGICFADMGKEALKISIKDDPTNFKQIIDAGRAYNLDSIGIQSNSIKLGTSLQALEQKDSVILFCNEESANAWKDGADKYSDAVLKDCIGVIFRDTNEMFVFNQIAGTTRINDINMLYVQNRTNKSVKVKMESHGRTITIEEQEGAAGSGGLIGRFRGLLNI